MLSWHHPVQRWSPSPRRMMTLPAMREEVGEARVKLKELMRRRMVAEACMLLVVWLVVCACEIVKMVSDEKRSGMKKGYLYVSLSPRVSVPRGGVSL
jgi:hypothetical protein